MLEKINKTVAKFIKETEIMDIEDFIFLNRLIDIFENNYKGSNIPKYRNKQSFEKSYYYAYDFLKSINPSYANYLEASNENNIFELLINSDEMAYSTKEDGVKKIYLAITNTIGDSYTIAHEIIHDMSLEENISMARHVFCESFSLLAEELQYEYFKENKKAKDYTISRLETLETIHEYNESIRIEQKLIEIYLNKGAINSIDIVELYEQCTDKEIFKIAIENLVNKEDISIDIKQRYVIGILFAYHMLDRIHSNRKNMQEFFDLNEMINYYDPIDFVEYLGLELRDGDIFDLTDESYKELEQSFVKILKIR